MNYLPHNKVFGGLWDGGSSTPHIPQPHAQPAHVVLRFCHQRDPVSQPVCSPSRDPIPVRLEASAQEPLWAHSCPQRQTPEGCLVQWMLALWDLLLDALCLRHKAHAFLPVLPITVAVVNPSRTLENLGEFKRCSCPGLSPAILVQLVWVQPGHWEP